VPNEKEYNENERAHVFLARIATKSNIVIFNDHYRFSEVLEEEQKAGTPPALSATIGYTIFS
jgi:hypothetical protein